MKMDKHRTLQLICFAILMAFLIFAFTVEACDSQSSNVRDLQTLATLLNPVQISMVKK